DEAAFGPILRRKRSRPMGFTRIFGNRSVFTALEQRLLDELKSRLAPEAGQRLAQQLERITLVQRHMESREICCDSRRWGRRYRDAGVAFRVDGEELKLGTVRFRRAAERQVWKAEFWVVRGHLFSIDFKPKAQSIQQMDAIEIESVEIHHDPMQPAPTQN